MRTRSFIYGRIIASLVLAVVASTLAAHGAGKYEGGTWAFLDQPKALAAAADITTAKYPNCDEATVDKKMVRVYRADGTGEAQDESYLKVLTEKGKRNNRTLSLNFMLPYETVEVMKLEVIKPGGEVQGVDVAANSKEMIDDSQMAMNIYDPHSKVLHVNIPQLDIGDVVHSIVRTTTVQSIMPGESAEYNVFEGNGYLRHVTYEVHSPKDKPLRRRVLRDEVPGTIQYSSQPEGSGTLHRWEITNVPRMFDEPSMPPYEMTLQRLLLSTTADWPTVSRWYWKLCKPHLDATTPEMKKAVQDLVAGKRTDEEKLEAVFYYVSKTIRYMGITPEKDRPGFEPHDVRMCYDNKFGVCRDKAALLVSMLRLAGIRAFPVLINVGVKLDQDAPCPDFNHAIVAAELVKGHYVLMDPTVENTKVLLPSYESNRSFLVCRPEGEKLATSPITPADENMLSIRTDAVLDGTGHLEGTTRIAFEGINDNAYREGFSHMKPDDRRRFFEGNLKRAMSGARLKSVKITPDKMEDVSQVVKAELEFSADGMLASSGDTAVANLPWLGQGLGVVSFVLEGTGLEQRKYPLQTEVACGLREDIHVKLGADFKGALSMPACSPINDDCLSYRRSVEFKDHALDAASELKLKVVEFTPKEYLKLKQTLKAMAYDKRKAPVLAVIGLAAAKFAGPVDAPAPPKVESNAKILESRKELEVKDAHSAVYKVKYSKRILTYSGKKNEAEIKVDYNPSCQEARLLQGVVTSKTGERQEIKKEEINVMDAGWNASAKRYTGGKILVANLPGVDVGSTIEVEYEITTHGKPFVSGFEAFQVFDDLDQKSFRLSAPAGVPIQKIITGPGSIVSEHDAETGPDQRLQWTSQNVRALPAERQLPPEWYFLPGVQYFVGDLKAYLADLGQTLLDRSAKGIKAAEKARQLAGGTKDKLQAITAIRDFVAESIRLAGPSFTELPLSELSAADTTLDDGYGHAADRAILLHSMLTAAGLSPEFVLASDLPPIAGITNLALSFPLPQNFEAPLVKVTVEGTSYYLNDTDQYAHLGATEHEGRLAVDLATRQTMVIEPAPGCEDKTDTAYTLSLGDDGKTRIGITKRYYGENYGGNHKFFAELPPEERRRFYQELVSDVVEGAHAVGDLTTQFDCYPGLEQFTVEIDNYGVVDGKYLYFDLPFKASLFPAGADQRSLPLYLNSQSDQTIHTDIELPPGFRRMVIAPQAEDLYAPGGGGKAHVATAASPGNYGLTHELENTPAIVAPSDYAGMLAVEAALGRRSSRLFLLEKD